MCHILHQIWTKLIETSVMKTKVMKNRIMKTGVMVTGVMVTRVVVTGVMVTRVMEMGVNSEWCQMHYKPKIFNNIIKIKILKCSIEL